MATKRPFADLVKLEDINDNIKRQIPLSYPSTMSKSTTSSLLAHPTMQIGLRATPAHNGLDAFQQIQLSKEAQKNKDLESRLKSITPPCKNCQGNDNVIEDERAGAYICTKCGLETGRIIIETAEWRNFGDGKSDPSRVTAEDKYHGLENAVRNDNGGKKTQEERRMAGIKSYLDQLCRALKSPENLFHASCRLAQQYLAAPIDIIGQSVNTESLAAASFHASVSEIGNPVRKEDIIAILNLREKSFNRAQKRLSSVRVWAAQKNDKEIPVNDPIKESIDYLSMYSRRLSLSPQSLDAASCIIKTAYELDINRGSKSPTTAAAAILFTLTLQERQVNPHELARVSHTTFETIRRHAHELFLKRDLLVPDGFVEPQQIQNMKAP